MKLLYTKVLDYYISFLKALSLKLDKSTVNFFFNGQEKDFPLYTEAIKFINHKETMVRIAVRTLTLNVFKVEDEAMRAYIINSTAVPYFSNIVWFIRQECAQLHKILEKSNHDNISQLNYYVEELTDQFYYLHDIFNLGFDSMNLVLAEQFIQRFSSFPNLEQLENSSNGGSSNGSPISPRKKKGSLRTSTNNSPTPSQQTKEKEKDKENKDVAVSSTLSTSNNNNNNNNQTFSDGEDMAEVESTSNMSSPSGDILLGKGHEIHHRVQKSELSSSIDSGSTNMSGDSNFVLEKSGGSRSAKKYSKNDFKEALIQLIRSDRETFGVVCMLYSFLKNTIIDKKILENGGMLPYRLAKAKKLLEGLLSPETRSPVMSSSMPNISSHYRSKSESHARLSPNLSNSVGKRDLFSEVVDDQFELFSGKPDPSTSALSKAFKKQQQQEQQSSAIDPTPILRIIKPGGFKEDDEQEFVPVPDSSQTLFTRTLIDRLFLIMVNSNQFRLVTLQMTLLVLKELIYTPESPSKMTETQLSLLEEAYSVVTPQQAGQPQTKKKTRHCGVLFHNLLLNVDPNTVPTTQQGTNKSAGGIYGTITHIAPLQRLEIEQSHLDSSILRVFSHPTTWNVDMGFDEESKCQQAKQLLERARDDVRSSKMRQIYSLLGERDPDDDDPSNISSSSTPPLRSVIVPIDASNSHPLAFSGEEVKPAQKVSSKNKQLANSNLSVSTGNIHSLLKDDSTGNKRLSIGKESIFSSFLNDTDDNFLQNYKESNLLSEAATKSTTTTLEDTSSLFSAFKPKSKPQQSQDSKKTDDQQQEQPNNENNNNSLNINSSGDSVNTTNENENQSIPDESLEENNNQNNNNNSLEGEDAESKLNEEEIVQSDIPQQSGNIVCTESEGQQSPSINNNITQETTDNIEPIVLVSNHDSKESYKENQKEEEINNNNNNNVDSNIETSDNNNNETHYNNNNTNEIQSVMENIDLNDDNNHSNI
ncbi:armadillo-like helical domain-containing protein [Heterostelium album PN500]|uniref:Armadillo-like helical domain-containing protein n=1 Tax=Heterostelium pallidum (strain ATCC 26659 / Pp 5 / PN500) TaxID=670386 RepID=D3BMH7_HETP5|nr:armadillo-like helical domain-containing protein [Heterostelium album PN500]EFA77189.1 armadillo-like helical domain-containing protein [Heterostelium album PN500]|eukprot:XP_020429318.1 armadillo-like helical domain-containing protein [Heterostelium album PN500]